MSKKLVGSFGLIELSQSAWGFNTEEVEKYFNQFGNRIAAQQSIIAKQVEKAKVREAIIAAQRKKIKSLEERVATLESRNVTLTKANEDAHDEARRITAEADSKACQIIREALVEKNRILEMEKQSTWSSDMSSSTPTVHRHGRVLSPDLRRFMKEVADVGREYLFDASMLSYYFDTLGFSLGKEKRIFQLAFNLGAIDALNSNESSKEKQSRARAILTNSCLLQEPVIKELIQAYIPYL